MPPSLYVHVPFCLQRCLYCAFYSGEALELAPNYPGWIRAEAALRQPPPTLSASSAATVYVGGGTPSLLGAPALASLLHSLNQTWGLSSGTEVTVEANPGDALDFSELRSAGVTRVSLGVQSLDDAVLLRLGRRHTAAEALRAVDLASHAGLRCSADLIFGLQGVRPDAFHPTVATLRSAGAEHLSTYSLEVHAGTPLAADFDAGRPSAAAPAAEEAQWGALDAALRSNGFLPYEVSNYCTPGAEARHNLAYWNGDAYVGLGPGAHSYDPSAPPWGVRSWNDPDLPSYARALDSGRPPPASREQLTRSEALLETLFLGLRRPAPVDFPLLVGRFALDAVRATILLDRAAAEGLLSPCPDRPGVYAATANGMRTADGLALWLRDGFTALRAPVPGPPESTP